MAQCPRCKENMPLLSKICPVCGYVEQDIEGATPDAVIEVLEENLKDIKNIPEPSFFKSMASLSFVMYPIITAFLIILSVITESGMFLILTTIFAIISIIALIRKFKGKLGNTPFNNEFRKLKNEYEQGKRLAERYYGKNKEIATLLNDISKQIYTIEQHRKQVSVRNFVVWIALIAAIVALSSYGTWQMNNFVKQNMPDSEKIQNFINEGLIDSAVTVFNTTYHTNQEVPLLLPELFQATIAAKQIKQVEMLFNKYCIGQTGDVEYGALIVQYYNSIGDKVSAEKFVETCDGMCYKSDKQTLRKLINK